MSRLQAPRGTFDVLPDEGRRRVELARLAGDVLSRAGYEPFEKHLGLKVPGLD